MKSLFALAGLFATIALLSLISWFGTPAQIVADTVPPPVMQAEAHFLESQLQLGVAKLNQQIGGAFTIINDTERTISLAEPFKSCACTDASVEKRSLAPGERCSVTVAVQTGTRRGKRAETVSVLYTEPDGSNVRQMIGRVLFEVKGVFEVDPQQLVLTRAEPRASFVIRADPSADRHDVLDVKSNHRCVKVNISALPVVKLELDLTTPDESILNVDCTIYTNNPAEDTIRVPIRVRKE